MTFNARLTSLSHGGGCGCKIAPGILSEILKSSPIRTLPPALLAGLDNNEDAAVYQINESQAIVATTDFFMPIVDDPFEFGRIAATNAISDVYAMGAQPLFALAILGMPINVLPIEVIQKITQNVSPGKLLVLSGMLGIQRFTIFTMFGFKIQDPSDSAMEQAQAMTGGAGG